MLRKCAKMQHIFSYTIPAVYVFLECSHRADLVHCDRRIVNCLIAPPRNILTYLLTYL